MTKYNRNNEAIRAIAMRLKELRRQTGKNQETVIRETGLNVGNIETEKVNITISSLDYLCRYYGISLKKFFEGLEL